jgi:uncharacterized repeat protein (TIGR01451 family)
MCTPRHPRLSYLCVRATLLAPLLAPAASSMSAAPGQRRTALMDLALRGMVATIGVLCLAVLTASVASAQSADLLVTKSGVPDPVTAGNQITYTVTVTNDGPNAAQNVTLTDQILVNTTFVSA